MNVNSDLCPSSEQRTAASCNGVPTQRFVGDVDLPEGILIPARVFRVLLVIV